MITWTNITKNSTTMTDSQKSAVVLWDDALVAWDSPLFSWDSLEAVFTEETKNITTYSNQTKS